MNVQTHLAALSIFGLPKLIWISCRLPMPFLIYKIIEISNRIQILRFSQGVHLYRLHKGTFCNYMDQILPNFYNLPPSSWELSNHISIPMLLFTWSSMDFLLITYPPLLVHVLFEWSLGSKSNLDIVLTQTSFATHQSGLYSHNYLQGRRFSIP